jgi:hypothetical protein
VRLTDFLRTAVLLSGGAATALGIVTVLAANDANDLTPLYVAIGWWTASTAIGLWLGQSGRPTRGIGRMMATARAATALPEAEPGAILWGRLWALAIFTILAGGLAFLAPQVPAIASGYALIVALGWRRQAAAVRAVEERDGVQFHLDRTSPFRPTRLIRTPGLRKFTDAADR